jgi:hypothetical protein
MKLPFQWGLLVLQLVFSPVVASYFGFKSKKVRLGQICGAALLSLTTLAPPIIAAPSGASFGPTPSYSKSPSGLEFYEYKAPSESEGPAAKQGDRVLLNMRAYLAGRQGWMYLDTFNSKSGEAVRLTLGETPCVRGLEIGLLGDGANMPAMKKGSKRRLLVPSSLGYTSRAQLPQPQDEGLKRRLFNTVFNPVRADREAEALGGESIVGKLIMDIQLISIQKGGIKNR